MMSRHSYGQDSLIHGETLFAELDHTFHSSLEHQQQLLCPYLSAKGMLFIHCSKFPAAGDWEGDFQFHPETANHLQDALKKRQPHFIFTTVLYCTSLSLFIHEKQKQKDFSQKFSFHKW